MSMMITGAGLVGSQIARLEQEAGRRPVIFSRAAHLDALADFIDLANCVVIRGDVTNPFDLVAAVKANNVRRIVHMAAFGNLTLGSKLAPYASTQVNVLGTANVLEIARILELDRVVVGSSSVLYLSMDGGGDNGKYGYEEAHPRPNTVYAANKQAVEGLASAYRHEFGLETVSLRYGAIFGPWRSGGGGVATTMFEDWLRAAVAGKPVGIGASGVDWVYSKDAAKAAHLACWADGLEDHVFNVSMGRGISGEEIAAAINAVIPGNHAKAAPSASSTASAQRNMNIDRARRQLGFEVAFPIETAVRDYLNWISEHPASSRDARG